MSCGILGNGKSPVGRAKQRATLRTIQGRRAGECLKTLGIHLLAPRAWKIPIAPSGQTELPRVDRQIRGVLAIAARY